MLLQHTTNDNGMHIPWIPEVLDRKNIHGKYNIRTITL